MKFKNFKFKFIVMFCIIFFILLIFKFLHLFCLFKYQEQIKKKLEMQYNMARKKKKLLQEQYWNIKYCHNI